MSFRKLISTILLVKSFVFGALVLGIWGRSYFVSDSISVHVGMKSTSITAADGLIVYRAAADGEDAIRLEQMTRKYITDEPKNVIAALPGGGSNVSMGFSYDKRPMFETGQGLLITATIPCWLLFLLGSSKAIFWLARRRMSKAIAPVLENVWCVRCQCEQPAQEHQCVRCGSPVVA